MGERDPLMKYYIPIDKNLKEIIEIGAWDWGTLICLKGRKLPLSL